jgi:hypothetical protein
MILRNILAENNNKKQQTNGVFLFRTLLISAKIGSQHWFLRKNANYLRQKSPKIMIKTFTPGICSGNGGIAYAQINFFLKRLPPITPAGFDLTTHELQAHSDETIRVRLRVSTTSSKLRFTFYFRNIIIDIHNINTN